MITVNSPSLFKADTHKWIFFVGLSTIAFALPWSVWLMSFGQFILAGNWLLEGQYRAKIVRYWKNKAAVAFSMVFLVFLVALLHTADTDSGLLLIRILLPLLVLTFLVASSDHQLEYDKTLVLLLIFCLSVLFITKIGFLSHLIEPKTDFRQLSPFITHIRLGLMIAFSAFLIPWLFYEFIIRRDDIKKMGKWIMPATGLITLLSVGWLLFFLTQMLPLSAIIALLVVVGFLVFYFLINANKRVPAIILGIVAIAVISTPTIITFKLYRLVTMEIPVDLAQLPTHTSRGNPYHHMPEIKQRENGHLVYIMISDTELREAWNYSSELEFDGYDQAGQLLRFTLYRYMTSLGLTKDKDGFEKLSEYDIRAIEGGIANHLYTEWPGLIIRVHQTLWEIQMSRKGANPGGHTMGQRLEYWNAAWLAFLNRPLFGWGLGDVEEAKDYGLIRSESPLSGEFHHRAHNQWLSFLLYFGIVGTIIVVGLISYTIAKTKSYTILPFIVFFLIFLVSTLSDDTFETQAGLTFFALFFVFFNFLFPKEKQDMN